jgi:membrane-associated phospholipid phosphatase
MRERLRYEWKVKAGMTVLAPAVFCAIYFWLERNPRCVPAAMPVTALDRAIPFQEWALWPYLSLYLLTPIGPWLADSRRLLVRYLKGLAALSSVSFTVFWVFPTTITRPDPSALGPAYRGLVALDTTLNAFPSLHAALAVYSALCWRPARAILLPWAAVIVYSTLATKQHVAVDAAAGMLLGALSFRWAYGGRAGRSAAPKGHDSTREATDERLQRA